MTDTATQIGVPIGPGQRVTWLRPGFDPVRERAERQQLTGTVREVKREDGYEYAIVATEPDGRLTMPALSMLRLVDGEGGR